MEARLTQEQVARCRALAREGENVQDVAQKVFEHGLYQLEYRRKRNKVQAVDMKELRAMRKVVRANPELAVKFGLGTKVELS